MSITPTHTSQQRLHLPDELGGQTIVYTTRTYQDGAVEIELWEWTHGTLTDQHMVATARSWAATAADSVGFDTTELYEAEVAHAYERRDQAIALAVADGFVHEHSHNHRISQE